MKLILRVFLPLLLATGAMAGTIDFTGSYTAMALLNGRFYDSAAATINFSGDTADVVHSSGIYTLDSSHPGSVASLTLAGAGTLTFTGTVSAVLNPGAETISFIDRTTGYSIITFHDAAFAGYDMASSLGPINKRPGYIESSPSASFGTSGGTLKIYDAFRGSKFSFQAVRSEDPTPTPEPVTAIPVCLSLLALVPVTRRLRRA